MVKRYGFDIAWTGGQYEAESEIQEDGGYVEYADYAALEARVAELERDAARYRFIRRSCDTLELPDSSAHGWIFQNNGCSKLDAWVDSHIAMDELK